MSEIVDRFSSKSWPVFYSLLAVHPGISGTEARSLLWRAVRSPLSMSRWLFDIDDLSRNCGLEHAPLDLARKPRGEFLSRSLHVSERFHLFGHHYRHLASRFSRDVLRALLAGEGVDLFEFAGKSGDTYRIWLSRKAVCRKEGEVGILLSDSRGRRVASLTFTVGALSPDGPSFIWIGALQGCADADAKTATVQVTRDMFGLRPKDLLVHAAYAIGRALGVRRVKAISNRLQMVAMTNGSGRHADYDAFWTEIGGTLDCDGFFLLPIVRSRRREEEVAPAKRKAWRARYAVIDALGPAVSALGKPGEIGLVSTSAPQRALGGARRRPSPAGDLFQRRVAILHLGRAFERQGSLPLYPRSPPRSPRPSPVSGSSSNP